MCEMNPKRAGQFTVEVFTSHKISDEYWIEILKRVGEALFKLEIELNDVGDCRVHVHSREI